MNIININIILIRWNGMGSSLVATRDTSTTIHIHDIISVLTGEDGEWEEDEGYVIIVFAHQSPHRQIKESD